MADNKYIKADRQRLIACMASREHALKRLDKLVEDLSRDRAFYQPNPDYPHELVRSIQDEVQSIRYDLNRYECGDEKTEALAACEVAS
tara:strand:+ start:938 stop:1201 length:264 start_codon:yes stop_codon:yes gene_type:complete